jgi:hypothetical protein
MPAVSLVIGSSSSGVKSTFWILPGFSLPFFACHSYFFFAVLADCLNAFAVGAPFDPGLRIFSPDPLAIRSCFL